MTFKFLRGSQLQLSGAFEFKSHGSDSSSLLQQHYIVKNFQECGAPIQHHVEVWNSRGSDDLLKWIAVTVLQVQRNKITIAVQNRAGCLSGPVRDTPPYRAIPFRDSIAEGVSHTICLVFIGYRASIADIPVLRGGYRTSTSRALQGGKLSEKGEGVLHPIGHA